MIVFNVKAALCGAFGLLLGVALGPIGFIIGAAALDLVFRIMHAGTTDTGFLGATVTPSAGGTLFWVIPVWSLAPFMLIAAGVGALGELDELTSLTSYGGSGKAARPTPIIRPDDSHLIAKAPPPAPKTALRVVSTPPDADVQIDSASVGATPLFARVLVGVPVNVVITKPNHVPVFRRVDIGTTTSTLTVELEPGVPIELASTPDVAAIQIDDEPAGETPKAELMVPARRRFRLRVSKPGFATWVKKVRKPRKGTRYVAKLQPLPLSKLPLDGSEKREAADIRRAIANAKLDLARAKSGFASAKANAARAQGSYQRIDAQNALEDAKAEVQARTGDYEDAKGQLTGLRDRVAARLADR